MDTFSPLFLILFGALVFMSVMWFVLTTLLFNHLKKNHPQKYASIGYPSSIVGYNIFVAWVTLKFIITRQNKTLNDKYLSKLSNIMLVSLIVYWVLFIILFITAFIAHAA
jgi:energy-coupling factor transporter transmembrane protein EcfT